MKHLTQVEMSEEETPMASRASGGNKSLDDARDNRKVEAYRSLNYEAIALAAAKVKCRKRLDLVLNYWPEDAQYFSQAMIEVGTAAATALGDAQSTVDLLTHLSRRIRAGDCLDF